MSDDIEVWIKTEPSRSGGSYVVTIEAGPDRAVTLNQDRAMKYAASLLSSCAYAEYDHSVFMQMRDVIHEEAAVAIIASLQQDRPPLALKDTAPLMFVPALMRDKDKTPVIQIRLDEEPIGHWNLPAAREHALTVIEAIQVADLDGHYLRSLRTTMGVEEAAAQNVVDDLLHYRPGADKGARPPAQD